MEAHAATRVLREALLEGAELGQERWLAAQLLDYHAREDRPRAWMHFRRLEMTTEELIDESESLAGLVWDGAEPTPIDQSLLWQFTFPAQQHRADPGDKLADPVEGGTGWTVHEIDNALGTVSLRRGKAMRAKPLPAALIPSDQFITTVQRAALRRFGEAVLDDDDRYLALRRLVRRDLPLGGAQVQRDELDEQRAVAVGLDRSYLFVQGPPGSGKTYRGARLITELLRQGKRVGVTSQSHRVIHNLLDAVECAAREEGLSFVGKKQGEDYPGEFITKGKNGDFEHPDVDLIAGTSWLFAREALDQTLDVLVIDEAGQISLADAIAMGTSAKSLILLGDPLQLAQVSQGVHPEGAGSSVLQHLLEDHDTIPENRGIFLTHTRRMHPDVCGFISQAFYDGRLDSIEECATRSTSLGTGIRWMPVEHEGNSVDSPQEAAAIAAEIRRVLAGTFTDANGTRPLKEDDVLVVAPYNNQVRILREALPDGVEVGTVDKFQGREAAIVFYSMASSTGEDVPRGLDFLLSRNRLNVAISRAQCLAYLVCSPRLLEVECTTIEQMRLANSLCRFVELATVSSPS